MGLGLGCLMTPGLGKDIQCQVWPYFSKLANHQSDVRPDIKLVVSLVIAYGHFNYHPQGSNASYEHRIIMNFHFFLESSVTNFKTSKCTWLFSFRLSGTFCTAQLFFGRHIQKSCTCSDSWQLPFTTCICSGRVGKIKSANGIYMWTTIYI